MNQEQQLNRTARQVKIVGGSVVTNRFEFPYQVSLLYEDEFLCGGSIISTLIILTAAHCVKFRSANKLKITAGQNDLFSAYGWEQTSMAREVFIPENYNHVNLHNDIAVILLESPLNFSSAVQNIYLPRKGDTFDNSVVVIGWGSQYEGSPPTHLLRKVTLPIIDNEKCKRSYEKVRMTVTNKMICAGEVFKDACQGDSGGPAVCKRKMTPSLHTPMFVLCGIVSNGHGCGRRFFPGTFTKVTEYIDWIEDIQELSKKTYPTLAYKHGKCRTDRFHCSNRCIPRTFVCDTVSDCAFNEDENSCTHYSHCNKQEFRCNDGACIGRYQVCNKMNDCTDGSDEEKCPTANETCKEDKFQCGSDKRCIPFVWRCDGQQDCDDNSDEQNCYRCNSDEFFCVADNKCITIDDVCDGYTDCTDSSDEILCSSGQDTAIYPLDNNTNIFCLDRFKCDNNRCIIKEYLCDKVDDCGDRSDERDCDFKECSSNEWECSNHECVHYRSECNGIFNCNDKSDEANCN